MNEEKKLFNPIAFENVDPRITALGTKSSEEKIYIILYKRFDDNGESVQEFAINKGRTDTYRDIERLLATYPVDIHNSIVLVEIPAVNVKGSGEWVMKHPSNAPSIYQFCKMVESYFGESAFDIEQYNSGYEDDGDDVGEPTPVIPMSQRVSPLFSADQVLENKEMASIYEEAMKDR